MKHFFLNFIVIASLLFFEYPKNITGKWLVESVDALNAEKRMNAEQRATFDKVMVEPFTNATFEFKPDQHFYLSADILNMPKDDFWEYDPAEGRIYIREYKDKTSLIMQIAVVERGAEVYFIIHETGLVLKMSRI